MLGWEGDDVVGRKTQKGVTMSAETPEGDSFPDGRGGSSLRGLTSFTDAVPACHLPISNVPAGLMLSQVGGTP